MPAQEANVGKPCVANEWPLGLERMEQSHHEWHGVGRMFVELAA